VTGAEVDPANGSAAPEGGADANGPGADGAGEDSAGEDGPGEDSAGDATGGGTGIRNVDVSSAESWSSTGKAAASPPKPPYPP
jgi:hypothetical protein